MFSGAEVVLVGHRFKKARFFCLKFSFDEVNCAKCRKQQLRKGPE